MRHAKKKKTSIFEVTAAMAAAVAAAMPLWLPCKEDGQNKDRLVNSPTSVLYFDTVQVEEQTKLLPSIKYV